MCIQIFEIKGKLFENYKASEGYPVVGPLRIINLKGNSIVMQYGFFLIETFIVSTHFSWLISILCFVMDIFFVIKLPAQGRPSKINDDDCFA